MFVVLRSKSEWRHDGGRETVGAVRRSLMSSHVLTSLMHEDSVDTCRIGAGQGGPDLFCPLAVDLRRALRGALTADHRAVSFTPMNCQRDASFDTLYRLYRHQATTLYDLHVALSVSQRLEAALTGCMCTLYTILIGQPFYIDQLDALPRVEAESKTSRSPVIQYPTFQNLRNMFPMPQPIDRAQIRKLLWTALSEGVPRPRTTSSLVSSRIAIRSTPP